MIERLRRLYSGFANDDRVLIVIFADPDAISSAMALKRLLWRRVASITIARINAIKRADNLAMLKLLKIQLSSLSQVNPADFTRLALVDSQPLHHQEMADLNFDFIIDHHPLGDMSASFIDVRPDYGATATILTEYLRAAKIVPSRNLATALFYGIKTDTHNFARQGQLEDMRAFRYLFPLSNMNAINKIENSEITRTTLKYLQQALAVVKIRKRRSLVFLEKVDNPDTLVQIADFFMGVYDINQSVVAGVFNRQLIIIIRTAGLRKDAGIYAAKLFGQFGTAGGQKTMARAEIPLDNLDPQIAKTTPALERFVRERVFG